MLEEYPTTSTIHVLFEDHLNGFSFEKTGLEVATDSEHGNAMAPIQRSLGERPKTMKVLFKDRLTGVRVET